VTLETDTSRDTPVVRAPAESASRTLTVIRPAGQWNIDLRELWAERELLWNFTTRNVKVRYKQSLAGPGWAIFQPLFSMVIFTVIFGHVAKLPSNDIPYPVFYYTAFLVWTYFATAINLGSNSLVDNQAILTKVYFPRVFLPISCVLSGLLDLAVATVLAFPLCFIYGVYPGPKLLLLPVAVIIAMATAAGLSSSLGTLNARFRDVRFIVPVIVQAGLFISPIAYSISTVPSQWRLVYALNPMASSIELARYAFVGQTALTVEMALVSSTVAIVLLIAGFAYARRSEATLADVI
jgi:lipopolysaccharide transport system permease protein